MDASTRTSAILRLPRLAAIASAISMLPMLRRSDTHVYFVNGDFTLYCPISELDSRAMRIPRPSDQVIRRIDSHCRAYSESGEPVSLPSTRELRAMKNQASKNGETLFRFMDRSYFYANLTNAARSLGYEDPDTTPAPGWFLAPDGKLILRCSGGEAVISPVNI